jgi:hypothetical protein
MKMSKPDGNHTKSTRVGEPSLSRGANVCKGHGPPLRRRSQHDRCTSHSCPLTALHESAALGQFRTSKVRLRGLRGVSPRRSSAVADDTVGCPEPRMSVGKQRLATCYESAIVEQSEHRLP